MALSPEFEEHLLSGITTTCLCWALERTDGILLGFTDHDVDLAFDDVVFKANTGLTAKALEQMSGLAVDNTEAVGGLSSAAVSEADIQAGRYDNAAVRAWIVNWADTSQRQLQFNGTLGEVRRGGGAFTAELRGLSEALNHAQGFVYQAPCSAVLGDGRCKFAFDVPGYAADLDVETVENARIFRFENLAGFDERWFEGGKFIVKSGEANGLVGLIKNDRTVDGTRVIELWQSIAAPIASGDQIRMEAGCDKSVTTCRLKFNNFLNFRGFPHIPGEDWLMSYPSRAGNSSNSSNSSSGAEG
ncbi:DUF2163 domain-containing protein [Cochlodiniinecator piscidefendens]|uniref:DUF2163 domain-containing protein n=1 Tax=Cochlodiniinecator piscidefendens TaxID=2715756 RepID=UPI00140A12DB|nr:DUF2163 domain-containing protein [Cochlodiniinecator piscidefendens]